MKLRFAWGLGALLLAIVGSRAVSVDVQPRQYVVVCRWLESAPGNEGKPEVQREFAKSTGTTNERTPITIATGEMQLNSPEAVSNIPLYVGRTVQAVVAKSPDGRFALDLLLLKMGSIERSADRSEQGVSGKRMVVTVKPGEALQIPVGIDSRPRFRDDNDGRKVQITIELSVVER